MIRSGDAKATPATIASLVFNWFVHESDLRCVVIRGARDWLDHHNRFNQRTPRHISLDCSAAWIDMFFFDLENVLLMAGERLCKN